MKLQPKAPDFYWAPDSINQSINENTFALLYVANESEAHHG